MEEMNYLKNLLEKRIEIINREIKEIEEKKDILSLKVKISSILSDNFCNIVLCRDEEIYKLISALELDITFDDYKSMKFIISSEDLFNGFVPEQLVIAKKQAQDFYIKINDKLEEEKDNIESFLRRVDSLKEEREKCIELKRIVTSSGLKRPILDTSFILNLLASVSMSDEIKTDIMQKLVVLNVQAMKEEISKKNKLQSNIYSDSLVPLESEHVSPIVKGSKVSDLEDESKVEDENRALKVRKELNGHRIELLNVLKNIIKGDFRNYLSAEQLDTYNMALSIVSNEKDPSLIGYVQLLEEGIKDIKSVVDLLVENGKDEDLFNELSSKIDEMDDIICDYQNTKRYFNKQKVIDQDLSLLRPFEKCRLVYLMHPKSKNTKLTEEDFFEVGLTSYFEEDLFSSDHVNSYSRISKLLDELRNGISEKIGRGEHIFSDGPLRGYHVKKNYKCRIGFRKINEEAVLVIGYADQMGKDQRSDTNYAKDWKNRQYLYGDKIGDIISRINNDPLFRDMVYRYSREVDDRIIDVIVNKKKNTESL